MRYMLRIGAVLTLIALAEQGPAQVKKSGVDRASSGSVAAIHAVTVSQLKLVHQWLDDKDFDSADEATLGLTMLAQLYGSYGAEPDWIKRSTLLHQECVRLAEAVKRRSAADSSKAAAECTRLLDDLARHPPTGGKRLDRDFKPFGATKTWMALMEGARVDAKRAESAKELELLALALAEEVQVVGFLRSEEKWRRSTEEVRETALQASRLARDNDLAAARKALKEMYQRCEACHQRDKR